MDLGPIGEVDLRGLAYFSAIALVGLWESLAPRRPLACSLRLRWFGNFAVSLIGSAFVYALFPMLSIELAEQFAARRMGLLNQLDLPLWLGASAAFLLLDLNRYLQHILMHRVPVLWLFHAMHHTDQDYDFTTGLRFHPIEMLASTMFNLAVVAALGPPVEAVVVYEALSVAIGLAAHGNVRMPQSVDAALRRVLVTPDLHRIHHSMLRAETNSNFGGVLTSWDRLFRTYRNEPAQGQDRMRIGLSEFDDASELRLLAMLTLPLRFRRAPAAGPLRRF